TEYIPQAKLSKMWEKVSRGSPICHIKRIPRKSTAAHYITSYAAKGSDITKLPQECIAEWAENVAGKRFAQTFGSLHGHKTTPEKKEANTDYNCIVQLGVLSECAWDG